MVEIVMAVIDEISEKIGNQASMGTSQGVTPQKSIWSEILGILFLVALIIGGIYLWSYL